MTSKVYVALRVKAAPERAFAVFTAWGLWEIITLPPAELP